MKSDNHKQALSHMKIFMKHYNKALKFFCKLLSEHDSKPKKKRKYKKKKESA